MARFALLWLTPALLLAAPATAGENCWNIQLDFSGVQGNHDWSYGYRDSGGPFTLMPEFNSTQWAVHYTGTPPIFWTHITTQATKTLMHPNGLITSGGRQPVDHEAVLRWTSPLDGDITINTSAGKDNTGGGNGVDWIIRHNGATLQSFFIAFNDAVGITYQTTLSVSIGDTIDFALNSHASNDLGDTTHFTAIITVPPPDGGMWRGPDINRDCQVNVDDLLMVINGWGACPNRCATPCPADVNLDCTVNVDDLLEVINNWG